jgi:hypothetical protein
LATAQRLRISPIEADSSDFQSAVSSGGQYLWAVTEGGALQIVPKLDVIKHPVLTGGGAARGAGEVTIGPGGIVTNINNFTGHYTPTCRCGADLQAGVDAFINVGVPVKRSAITSYDW